ncbi:Arylsulfatase [Novipirellula artificiosorum]|uniref:Arylsulfatase n=2 Tax=Novipirellula artificiosorum TaxID=2528016 RepID=A0A5C6D635_9BACT|nr:Arylsulfatase [Novipirellula artificiosorum]
MMMTNPKSYFFIATVAALSVFSVAYGQESRTEEKTPNVVLIMADDLGWKDLHCYGNDKLDTPSIDRLAEQGLLFTDAYSAAPVCTPTRAALMTGESPTYAAMIEGMDESIGKLLKAIEEQGLNDNTLVIFTSDNGPFAANVKPLRAEKCYLYEGGIRVPMIVRWPGRVMPSTRTSTPVIIMDIHATILEVANLKTDPSNTPDGVSLLPMLKDESKLERESIYFHYPNYAFHKGNRLGSAVRSGDFKLI